MEEIKNILDAWEEEGTANGTGIEKAFNILTALVTKVEELEAQVQALSE